MVLLMLWVEQREMQMAVMTLLGHQWVQMMETWKWLAHEMVQRRGDWTKLGYLLVHLMVLEK